MVPLLGGHHGANALARLIADALGVPAGDHHRRRQPLRHRPRRRRRRAGTWPIPAMPRASWLGCWKVRRAAHRRVGRRRMVALGLGRLGGPGGARGAGHPPRGRPARRAVWSITRRCWRWASAPSWALRRRLFGHWSTRRSRSMASPVPASPASSRSISRPPSPRSMHLALRAGAVLPGGTTAARRPSGFRHAPRLVFRETGCWGVAEGAALAAVGSKGRLLVPKRKGSGSPAPWPSLRTTSTLPRSAGRKGGSPWSASGPAAPYWRTAEARAPAGRSRGTGRLRPLSRPDRAGRCRQAAPRVPARRPRWTAAARRSSWPPKAAASPWSARAIPGSMPWPRWCSSCWRAATDPPGAASR